MKVELRLEVATIDRDADGTYVKTVEVRPELLPAEGDLMSPFDQMQLSSSDIGLPLAQIEGRLWSADLTQVELHLDCTVESAFFYDRPWRQHLLSSDWVCLDEETRSSLDARNARSVSILQFCSLQRSLSQHLSRVPGK